MPGPLSPSCRCLGHASELTPDATPLFVKRLDPRNSRLDLLAARRQCTMPLDAMPRGCRLGAIPTALAESRRLDSRGRTWWPVNTPAMSKSSTARVRHARIVERRSAIVIVHLAQLSIMASGCCVRWVDPDRSSAVPRSAWSRRTAAHWSSSSALAAAVRSTPIHRGIAKGHSARTTDAPGASKQPRWTRDPPSCSRSIAGLRMWILWRTARRQALEQDADLSDQQVVNGQRDAW